MKLSNIFKTASPLFANVVMLLISIAFFIDQNQEQISNLLATIGLSISKVNHILATIVLVGGFLKAFTSDQNTDGGKSTVRQTILKQLIKLLVYLTKDTPSEEKSPQTPQETAPA